jgi:uncharacterized protein YjbI with pentapeptide repeats
MISGSQQNMTSLVAKAIEDTGKHYTALSVTFLLACLYIVISAASTTHRQLLLGVSLTLPLLGVAIPLTGFNVVAPAMLVGLHMHLLLQQHVLVRRLSDQRIREFGGDEDFFLFPALPVVRYVLRLDEAWLSRMVRAGIFLLNVLLPIGALCLVQYEFLPYHSFWITSWHQLLVVIDLTVCWYFMVVLPPHSLKQKHSALRWYVPVGIATGGVLYFSLCLAILPRAWIERVVGGRFRPHLERNLYLPGELLIAEGPSPEVLAAFVSKGESREAAFLRHAVGARLEGRDLRGANFEEARLLNADLRGADLREAWLVQADLRGAKLTPSGVRSTLIQQPRGSQKSDGVLEVLGTQSFERTRLDGAKLMGVKLEGANLILASFIDADLRDVKLTGLELTGGNFQGAHLQGAKMERVELSHANLDNADLTGASLEAAIIDHASLAGASLVEVHANAASFANSNLEGATLANAMFRVADFRGALLTGSDFRRASLEGATALLLNATDLRGAYLGGACPLVLGSLNDFRSITFGFLAPKEWKRISETLFSSADVGGASNSVVPESEALGWNLLEAKCKENLPLGHCQAILARIEEASRRQDVAAQAACLSLLSETPTRFGDRKFLYFDEERTGVFANWPPVSEQRRRQTDANGIWNESAFRQELASSLLRSACSRSGLAKALAFRAAGEYSPGDLEFDEELAQQLLLKLEDEGCEEMRGFSEQFREDLKRQVKWRLRSRVRGAGEHQN